MARPLYWGVGEAEGVRSSPLGREATQHDPYSRSLLVGGELFHRTHRAPTIRPYQMCNASSDGIWESPFLVMTWQQVQSGIPVELLRPSLQKQPETSCQGIAEQTTWHEKLHWLKFQSNQNRPGMRLDTSLCPFNPGTIRLVGISNVAGAWKHCLTDTDITASPCPRHANAQVSRHFMPIFTYFDLQPNTSLLQSSMLHAY
ncbi:hypothetical protein BKA56DRAFT_33672 [Ilyonectria sp. MPI-CAGE-AT-0026]|nr:hypothetical protein BKA56DRAFT_33672 [Ilyonectria sp. MPI-CAGE-AT-0026]